ncbi:hypothetical protein RB195_018802 [Necator americanus]|uniref:Uncharacterized protein n=1 Tax=Necator americanus TaxID=51031 RepID=A0ABR1CCZ5_NECAM
MQMDRSHIRVISFYELKQRHTARQTAANINDVEETATVSNQFHRFDVRKLSFVDLPHTGHPCSNIDDNLSSLLERFPNATMQTNATELGVAKTTIEVFVHAVDYWKVRSRWVRLALIVDQNQPFIPDNQLCRSHQNLLRLVIVRYFRHIREFGVPIAFFTHTVWNVILEDCTTNGQGYHGPADFSQFRNQVFISYVRTLLDLGVVINRLTLLDKHKISPYMMVMSLNKRRSLYMYPEFKRCRELFVCYDIGLVAPIFAHENDRFALLQVFEVDESHVLYKRDLLEYLSNAPKAEYYKINDVGISMRIVSVHDYERQRAQFSLS